MDMLCILWYCIVLHVIAFYRMVLHGIVLYLTALHGIALLGSARGCISQDTYLLYRLLTERPYYGYPEPAIATTQTPEPLQGPCINIQVKNISFRCMENI